MYTRPWSQAPQESRGVWDLGFEGKKTINFLQSYVTISLLSLQRCSINGLTPISANNNSHSFSRIEWSLRTYVGTIYIHFTFRIGLFAIGFQRNIWLNICERSSYYINVGIVCISDIRVWISCTNESKAILWFIHITYTFIAFAVYLRSTMIIIF